MLFKPQKQDLRSKWTKSLPTFLIIASSGKRYTITVPRNKVIPSLGF